MGTVYEHPEYAQDCETHESESYWICLQPRCHTRSTFAVIDTGLAMRNALAHMKRTGHPTSVTTTARTVSVFYKPGTISGAPQGA